MVGWGWAEEGGEEGDIVITCKVMAWDGRDGVGVTVA